MGGDRRHALGSSRSHNYLAVGGQYSTRDSVFRRHTDGREEKKALTSQEKPGVRWKVRNMRRMDGRMSDFRSIADSQDKSKRLNYICNVRVIEED